MSPHSLPPYTILKKDAAKARDLVWLSENFNMDLIKFGHFDPTKVPILTQPLFPQPRPYPPQVGGPYMQNGSGPVPGARPLLPDNGRVIQSGPTRVLCIADVRGKMA